MTASDYRRYIKLGHQGEELPDDATDYVAVRAQFFDAATGTIQSLDFSRDTLPCGRVDYAGALKACEELELCGKKGWRLTSRAEMLSLVDDSRHDPAIDPIFNCESAYYWTSTPAAYSPSDCAWFVGFYDGYASWVIHGNSYFVRAVRSSQ